MNNDLLKRYIDEQPTKIITKLDFATGKLSYLQQENFPMIRLFVSVKQAPVKTSPYEKRPPPAVFFHIQIISLS